MPFEFKRVVIESLAGKQIDEGLALLNRLGADGWEIRGVVRNVSGNSEVVYLQRELEV
jgi:hypothetical protein